MIDLTEKAGLIVLFCNDDTIALAVIFLLCYIENAKSKIRCTARKKDLQAVRMR